MLSRRVAYVQHAGALGGSAVSLLYTAQAVRHLGWDPTIILARPTPALIGFYTRYELPIVQAADIGVFAHTTGGYARLSSPRSCLDLTRQVAAWRRSKRATLDAVAAVKPDVVHLNSVVLLPSAQALREHSIPHVWHVRECPPNTGARTRFIGAELLRHEHVIFLSSYDRDRWVGARTGTIVENFVLPDMPGHTLDKGDARRVLGLPPDRPLVLYLGGLTAIKGFDVLIESLPRVLSAVPDTLVAMLGSELKPSQRISARVARQVLPLVGSGTRGQLIQERLHTLRLDRCVRLLPFAEGVTTWIAASDVLVFPSTAPHFARPVIEAAALGRPVVASDIGGVRALVNHGVTGLLVPPANPSALADAVATILSSPARAAAMGAAARALAADRFSAASNARQIVAVYSHLVASGIEYASATV